MVSVIWRDEFIRNRIGGRDGTEDFLISGKLGKNMIGFLLLSIAHPDRMRGICYLLVREGEILGLIVRINKGLGKCDLNFSCSPKLFYVRINVVNGEDK